jgi:hypothetical protein
MQPDTKSRFWGCCQNDEAGAEIFFQNFSTGVALARNYVSGITNG